MKAPPQILIADDNPENLDILGTRLAAHGYEILTASDGEAAYASGLPDLADFLTPALLEERIRPAVDAECAAQLRSCQVCGLS